jgi:ketosteroid isomerase-like protein
LCDGRLLTRLGLCVQYPGFEVCARAHQFERTGGRVFELDMHRELHTVYVAGNVVIVQLSLQGTHNGPLDLPAGTVPPTGKRMDAPCCDVFELVDGKIKRFDCYPSGTVIAQQLGLA